MAFSEKTVITAYLRAEGKCECSRKTCGHNPIRCNKQLIFKTVEKIMNTVVGKPITVSQLRLAVMTAYPIAKSYAQNVTRTRDPMGVTDNQR